MQNLRSCRHSRFVISVLALGGFLALLPSGFASPAGEPDVSTANTPRQPHSVDQELKLADQYMSGRGVAQDAATSAHWLEKAADAGNPHAQLAMGYLYETGIGVAKDPALAQHWYSLAAADGLADAKTNLGMLYLWGTGVPQNISLAAQLFREAANEGSGQGACDLGNMYYHGLGVPLDQQEAERWYRKGAKLHNPQAEFELGQMLFSGKDHVHDLHAAAGLLRHSAAAGSVPAMYALGLLLARNPELAKSSHETTDLLNESARAGIWKSSEVLGVLARDGNGVPQNAEEAYFHFRVAALQGGEEAEKKLANDLRILSAKIGAAQTADLDSKAAAWYQHHRVVLEFISKESDNRNRFPAYAFALPADGGHALQLLPTWNEDEDLSDAHGERD